MKHLLFGVMSVLLLSLVAQPLIGQSKTKTSTVTGTVKSVSGSSLVLSTGGGKEMSLTIDDGTKVVGKGLTTKKMAKGKKLTAAEAIATGDQVSVTYHDMGGTMHAAQVQVLNKKN